MQFWTKRFALGLFIFLAPLTAALTDAHASERYSGGPAAGMADVYVAGNGSSAIFHNPAALSVVGGYHAELGYQHGFDGKLHSLGLAVVDSSTNPLLAGGMSYQFNTGGGFGGLEDFTEHEARLSISAPIVPGAFMMGFGVRYINHSRALETATSVRQSANPIGIGETTPPLSPPASDAATSRQRYGGFAFDLGLFAIVSEYFGLSASFQNLGGPSSWDAEKVLRLGGGVYYQWFSLLAEVGITFPEDIDNKSHFGVASAVQLEPVALRAGIRRDNLVSATFWGVGGGWYDANAGIEVSYQGDINSPNHQRLVVFARLTL